MARVVILGAGISGHTAASFLRKWLGKNDDVVVVSPLSHYNWIPSNIWVGEEARLQHARLDEVAFISAGLCGPDEVVAAMARRADLHVGCMQRRAASETRDRSRVRTCRQQAR